MGGGMGGGDVNLCDIERSEIVTKFVGWLGQRAKGSKMCKFDMGSRAPCQTKGLAFECNEKGI